jgi:hypothetical protein
MSRRKKIVLAVCAAITVIATVVLWPRPKGFVYEGKTVEKWFEGLLPGSTNRVAAERAFMRLGSNAIPHLVSVINRRETAMYRFRFRLAQKIPSSLNRFLPKLHNLEAEQTTALKELGQLGPLAEPATPAICALLRYHCKQAGPVAPFAWTNIVTATGGSAVPRLSGQGVRIQFATSISALVAIGGEDREIVLSLIEAARTEPMLVITRFRRGVPPHLAPAIRNSVPELVRALDDPFTCVVAARMLEWVEPEMPEVAAALSKARAEAEEPLRSLMKPSLPKSQTSQKAAPVTGDN